MRDRVERSPHRVPHTTRANVIRGSPYSRARWSQANVSLPGPGNVRTVEQLPIQTVQKGQRALDPTESGYTGDADIDDPPDLLARGSGLTSYHELVEVLENLPLLLRHTRRAADNMSVHAVGDKIGVDGSLISRFERGGNIRSSALIALVRFIGGLPPAQSNGKPQP